MKQSRREGNYVAFELAQWAMRTKHSVWWFSVPACMLSILLLGTVITLMSNKIKCLYFPPPKKTQSSSLTCGVLLYWTTGIIIRSRPLFPVKHCSRFILDPAQCSSPPTVWLRSKILMFRSRIISVFVPSLADGSPSISFKKLVNYRSGIYFKTNKNWLFGWLRLVITNFTFGWGKNRCKALFGMTPRCAGSS